jgi:epoxyqueuosine reductase
LDAARIRAQFIASSMSVHTEDPRQSLLRTRLYDLGFDDVRFVAVPAAPAAPAGSERGLREWLRAGRHADMQWMERSLEKRLNPDLVLPGVRSIIMLGVSYWTERRQNGAQDPAAPRWARYALYEDYHDTMKPGLVAAGKALEEIYGVAGTDYRYYVDTGPVIDRGWAARAGIGFIGKNAMLISRRHGNWLFLAAILCRTGFAPDEPLRHTAVASTAGEPAAGDVPEAGLLCGKCTRCLEACPTQAFVGPGVVDARRCISYQTIENKGVIPRELRAGIGQRIYGCDVCLEVCPWNRFARESRRLLLASRDGLGDLPLGEILALTPERFAEVFRRTPIKRLKLSGLLRNACIVAGNSGDRSLVPRLVSLAAGHPLALVRAHAVWAVFRLGAGDQLAAAHAREEDPLVRSEFAAEEAAVATGMPR